MKVVPNFKEIFDNFYRKACLRSVTDDKTKSVLSSQALLLVYVLTADKVQFFGPYAALSQQSKQTNANFSLELCENIAHSVSSTKL